MRSSTYHFQAGINEPSERKGAGYHWVVLSFVFFSNCFWERLSQTTFVKDHVLTDDGLSHMKKELFHGQCFIMFHHDLLKG